jgi:hypothetical protein
MSYAKGTDVPADRSVAEIERTLKRFGATSFMYGVTPESACIAFEAKDRRIKFDLPLLPIEKFARTQQMQKLRTPAAMRVAKDADDRRRWRALLLVIKAKLEAIESGIAAFEQEFFAHVMMPDGGTVYEHARGPVEEAYRSGKMPSLLPSYRPERAIGVAR